MYTYAYICMYLNVHSRNILLICTVTSTPQINNVKNAFLFLSFSSLKLNTVVQLHHSLLNTATSY